MTQTLLAPTQEQAAAEQGKQSFYCEPTVPAGEIAPGLAPKIAELGLERNCRELAEQGFTIVEDVAPPEFIARLRACILEKANPGGLLLLERDPVFAEAVLNPKLMAMAEFSVGAGFLLSEVASWVRPKGSRSIPLHADQQWVPAPFPEHNLFTTHCWACDEFTKPGGCTMVIPGSHVHRRHPTLEEAEAKVGAIATECPPGSVAIWDGAVWHANWPREIDGERVTLHVSYSRLLMRQMEVYDPATEDALIEQYGEDMAQLMGRHDFLASRQGKADVAGFWRASKNART